jgi:hypothetical protein
MTERTAQREEKKKRKGTSLLAVMDEKLQQLRRLTSV